MRTTAFLCAMMIYAVPAAAQEGNESYRNCVSWVTTDPVRAQTEAERWRDAGGGLAARHCRALALAAQEKFGDAAVEAEAVAAETDNSGAYVNLLIQAAEFRMAAGDATGARIQFDRALAASPDNAEALDGRARAAAAFRDFAGAIADLDRLLAMQPGNAEALALRAAAKRQSGDAQGGLADSEAAVGADPSSAVAYFERGAARAVTGDRFGAEADWTQAATLDPGGPTGQLAQANLERLRGTP